MSCRFIVLGSERYHQVQIERKAMLSQYGMYFQLLLLIYCLSSFAFVRSPLSAITYFMVFRSVFSAVAFTDIKAFGVLPYFVPALVLLLIPAILALFSKKVKFHFSVRLYILFVMLVLFEGPIFILFFGTSPGLVIQEFLKISFPILAYVLFYAGINEKQDLRKAGRNILIISFIPVMVGYLSVITQTGYSTASDAFLPLQTLIAPASTIASRNAFGIFLALCFCHLIAYAIEIKTKTVFLYLGLVVAMIVIAQNRGTWIALFLAVFCSVFLFRRYLNIGKWVLGAVIIALLASPVVIHRFSQLHAYDQWGQSQDTATERLETSQMLFMSALESPIFGGGPFSFREHMLDNMGLPHNDYIRIAYEYGFPAMLIYILFLLSQFIWTLKHRNNDTWVYQYTACIGQIYIIIISTIQNVITLTNAYMLIFALMAVSHRAIEFAGAPENEKKKRKYNFLHKGSGFEVFRKQALSREEDAKLITRSNTKILKR